MEERDLLNTINQRLDRKDLVLPTLPDVALEANDLLKRDDINIQDLVKVIKKDPALAASVIKYANSVIVSGSERISSIERATIRIGLKRLRNVILSSAVEQIFFAKDVTFAFLLSHTWKDSSDAAVSAGATIATLHNKGIATNIDHDAVFLTGLVHNIGALPILTEADRLGDKLDKRFHSRKLVKKLIDEKSTEITKKILVSWNFDKDVIEAATRWPNLSYDPTDIRMIDILRLSMTNTNIPDEDLKYGLLGLAVNKEIIMDDKWNKDAEFKSTLATYKTVFL